MWRSEISHNTDTDQASAQVKNEELVPKMGGGTVDWICETWSWMFDKLKALIFTFYILCSSCSHYDSVFLILFVRVLFSDSSKSKKKRKCFSLMFCSQNYQKAVMNECSYFVKIMFHHCERKLSDVYHFKIWNYPCHDKILSISVKNGSIINRHFFYIVSGDVL